jgi:hypothetical protein
MDQIIILDRSNIDDFMGNCEYCNIYAELRPYGENGAKICFTCAMMPEHRDQTDAMFDKTLNGDVEPSPEQAN